MQKWLLLFCLIPTFALAQQRLEPKEIHLATTYIAQQRNQALDTLVVLQAKLTLAEDKIKELEAKLKEIEEKEKKQK